MSALRDWQDKISMCTIIFGVRGRLPPTNPFPLVCNRAVVHIIDRFKDVLDGAVVHTPLRQLKSTTRLHHIMSEQK